jgi:hypothetical protein
MGLTPHEFCGMSPKDFSLVVEGYRRRKLDEYKLNRNLMFIMARLWSSKPPNNPKELWDLGDEDNRISDEQAKELAEHFAKLNAKNG